MCLSKTDHTVGDATLALYCVEAWHTAKPTCTLTGKEREKVIENCEYIPLKAPAAGQTEHIMNHTSCMMRSTTGIKAQSSSSDEMLRTFFISPAMCAIHSCRRCTHVLQPWAHSEVSSLLGMATFARSLYPGRLH